MAKFIEFNTSNGPLRINLELILGYSYSHSRKALIIYPSGGNDPFVLECSYEEYERFGEEIEKL